MLFKLFILPLIALGVLTEGAKKQYEKADCKLVRYWINAVGEDTVREKAKAFGYTDKVIDFWIRKCKRGYAD